MPVGLMLRSMTSAEVTEWAAWFEFKSGVQSQQQTPEQVKAVLKTLSMKGKAKR